MFHYALNRGVLVLGHAETIGYHSDLFAVMNKKNKVYRKRLSRRRRRSWMCSAAVQD
jgi:chemotaxis methyl-accepting protein methylase